MIKDYIFNVLSWYIVKCKYTLKMIQINVKLNEVLSHILNMKWLYHFNYNWKVWLMWFHKKHLDKFFIQTSTSVLKKTFCWKIIFIWKLTRIMLEAFVSKSILYILSKHWMKSKKDCPQNISPKKYILLPKTPPLYVLSPLRPRLKSFNIEYSHCTFYTSTINTWTATRNWNWILN